MKALLITALVARAATADPAAAPPALELSPSLVGPPSIGFVLPPPTVDQAMVMAPPNVDPAMAIGPTRDLFGQLGQLADAFVGAVHWLVPAVL